MAIDPFISSLKASGTYRQLFDRSRVVTNASNVTPIIFGFSKKGLFNTAVFCPDSEFFISNFGSVDYSLERRGSYFHRAALELLEQGPIFVINLYDLSAEEPATIPTTKEEYYAQLNDTQYDLTDYKGFSLGSTVLNKPNQIEPLVNFYNKERFWFADTEALVSTNDSDNQLISFVNVSQRSVSVMGIKSSITGFDVKAKEWYGTGNVPDFMNENDYISDYFIDVYVFEGDFTDYENLSIDPIFGSFFDSQNGFKKEMLAEFAVLPQVNVLGSYSGAVIPDFIDKDGTNRYIQTLMNRDTTLSGVLCAVNEEVFDNENLSGTKIDLVGHNIEKASNEGLNSIDFLSYKDTIVSDLTYEQRQLVIDSTGSYENVNYTIPVDGFVLTADLGGLTDGRYVLDGLNIIDKTDLINQTENSTAVASQTVITVTDVNATVTQVEVNSGTLTPGVDYTTVGNVITLAAALAGGESIDVTYDTIQTAVILQPSEGYVINDLDTINAGASASNYIYNTGAWVATTKTITTVEDRIANAAGAVGVPAGLYIQDDTSEIVAVEAGTVSAVLVNAVFNQVVINKDSENPVAAVPAYLTYDGADWIATTNTQVFWNGDTIIIGSGSALYATLTADYIITQLADHVFVKNSDLKFAKVFQASDNMNYLELVIEPEGTETIQTSTFEVMIDPIYFDYDVSLDSYVVTEGVGLDIPALYSDIANGTIVSGDKVTYNNGVDDVDAFLKVIDYEDNSNFSYPSAAISSDKINGYQIELYSDADLAPGNQLTGADVPLFGETIIGGTTVGSTEFGIQTLKGSLNESYLINTVENVPNEFVLPAANAGDIIIGHFIVASPGTSAASTDAPSRLTRVNKISTLPNGDQQIRTDEPIFVRKANVADTFGVIERYLPIEEFVDFYDMTHLYGFRVKERQLPAVGDGGVSVYGVLTSTNLYSTLQDRTLIKYRYIVDTFNKGIEAESKSILTKLAKDYKDAMAICNAPSAKEFALSDDPVFTDAPTPTNPKPQLNTRYITTGGNQALNPETTYSLPGESNGGTYGAFYFPNLVVNERNKTFTVPPAMYVAKNFIEKHRVGNAWDIVAGKRRGLVSGRNVVGIEYVLTTADREYLEPFGLNPIVNQPGVGLKVTSNQTAKQQIVSALSYINVAEVIIEVQKGIEAILESYLWEFNTAQNRLEIKTLADAYLEGIKLSNGVYAYENVMDSTNNPNEIIDQQKGVIDTYVEPVKGMGILVHRTTILNTGQIESGDFVRL